MSKFLFIIVSALVYRLELCCHQDVLLGETDITARLVLSICSSHADIVALHLYWSASFQTKSNPQINMLLD